MEICVKSWPTAHTGDAPPWKWLGKGGNDRLECVRTGRERSLQPLFVPEKRLVTHLQKSSDRTTFALRLEPGSPWELKLWGEVISDTLGTYIRRKSLGFYSKGFYTLFCFFKWNSKMNLKEFFLWIRNHRIIKLYILRKIHERSTINSPPLYFDEITGHSHGAGWLSL